MWRCANASSPRNWRSARADRWASSADNHGNIGTSVTIGISTDYLQGRDPNQVFASCVRQRSGQEPLYPFSSMPESRL